MIQEPIDDPDAAGPDAGAGAAAEAAEAAEAPEAPEAAEAPEAPEAFVPKRPVTALVSPDKKDDIPLCYQWARYLATNAALVRIGIPFARAAFVFSDSFSGPSGTRSNVTFEVIVGLIV